MDGAAPVSFTILLGTLLQYLTFVQDAASQLKDVDIVRDLDIEGELIAAIRGKELVFAIDKV